MKSCLTRRLTCRLIRSAATLAGLVVGVCNLAAAPTGTDAAGPLPAHESALVLVAAVNAVAQSDVLVPPAAAVSCRLETLPTNRAGLLPHLSADHRRMIGDSARGRARIRRDVRSLDLLAMIDDADDAAAEIATIRAYFSARSVDLASGVGLSDGPYPLAFDWAVVLDRRTHTLFSFILNCRD